MPESLGEAVLELSADDSNLDTNLRGSERSVRNWGKNVKFIAAGVAAAIVATIGVAIKNAVQDAAEFETKFTEVRTLLDRDVDPVFLKKLQSGAQDLSKDFGVPVEEVLDGIYQALSAGVPKDNVVDFMRTALKTSLAGVTDTTSAVDVLTSVMNAYGAENYSAERAADVLFATMRQGKTTIGELSGSAFQALDWSAALGISLEELTAGVATLTSTATPTPAAFNRIRAAAVAIVRPTKELTAIWNKHGFESGQAALESIGLAKSMEILRTETGGQVGELQKLLGTEEAVAAVLGITSNNGERFNQNLQKITQSAGETNAAFDYFTKTAGFRWGQIQEILNVQSQRFGQRILPGVTAALTTLVGWMNKFFTWTGRITDRVFDWEEQNWNVIAALLKLAGFIASSFALFKGFRFAVRGIWLALTALRSISILSMGPIGLIIVAIAGIIAVILKLTGHWERIEEKISQVWTNIQIFLESILPGITKLFEDPSLLGETLRAKWQEFIDWAIPIWNTFVGWFLENVWPRIRSAWEAFIAWVTPIWDTVVGVIQATWQRFTEWFLGTAWPAIQSAWAAFIDWLPKSWPELIQRLQSLWENFTEWFLTNAWQPVVNAWEVFVAWATPIWNAFIQPLQATWERFSSWFVSTAWPEIQAAWSVFTGWLGQTWDATVGAVQATWQTVTNWFATVGLPFLQSVWETVLGGLKFVWDALQPLFATIAQQFGPVLQKLALLAGELVAWFKRNSETIWNFIQFIFKSVVGAILARLALAVGPIILAASFIINKWQEISAIVGQVLGTVVTALVAFLQRIIEIFANIVSNAIDPFILLLRGDFGGAFVEVLDFIKVLFGGLLSAITAALNLLITTFRAFVTGFWELTKLWFAYLWELVQAGWNLIDDWLIARWENFKSVLADIWNGIAEAITNVWNGAIDTIKNAINGIIRIINSFIRKVNAIEIRVPSVKIPLVGTVGGFTVGIPDVPTIPLLAQGAVDFAGGMAIVGEQGPELVNLPRHSNVLPTAMTNALTKKFAQQREIVLELDGNELGRILVDILGERQGRQLIRSAGVY